MKKIVRIKDTYEVVIDNCENMTNAEIKKTALEVIKLIQRKEVKDMYEPISSFKTFKYLDKTRQGLDIVKVFEDLKDNRMHVICHRPSDDTYIIGLGYSPDDGTWNQGRYDFSSLNEAETYLKKDYKVKEFIKETKDSSLFIKKQKVPGAKLVHENGEEVKKGDEVISFRGEKAVVTGWQVPAYEGKSGRVYVKWEGSNDEMGYYPRVFGLKWLGLPWEKKETEDIKVEDSPSKGEQIAKVFAEAFKGEVGPFGGEDPELHGNELTLSSQMPGEIYRFNDDGSVDFVNVEEVAEAWAKEDNAWQNLSKEELEPIIEEYVNDWSENYGHFATVKDLLYSDLTWFNALDFKDILSKVDAILNEEIKDAKIGDIPLNSPEEEVNITYTEKLKGGKNALTYGMIETAFKDRGKDGGKTFEAYIDVVIESLKDDIKNAEFIVSGEMKTTRRLLLEDYVKIEHLVEKAGLEDKLAIMKPLVDELSEKLNLNYWKQPKFKKSTQKQASRELRNKHRWDSKITKTMKPVFLCTKSDLTASYNDAKRGKLPEVFEGNLEKVRRDMAADYDRIMQGRDTYVEDPRINKTLPEIIDLYETALRYADDLEYTDYAREFALMLETIKKYWGLAGE